jgi:hypothetical protein
MPSVPALGFWLRSVMSCSWKSGVDNEARGSAYPAGYILRPWPLKISFWALVLTALLIVFWKDIKAALEEINNRLQGPPGPMGPLPSTDSHLLLQRRRKTSL